MSYKLLELTALLLATPFAYKLVAFLVRRRLQATHTATVDLSLLCRPRKNGSKIPGTAVICGGSIAGLLSARVCSDHFENVVIVDPEEWIATEEGLHDHHRQAASQKRSRVPQYTSLHLYQPFTRIALQKLFPDFELELQKEGGRLVSAETMTYISGVMAITPYHQYPNGILPTTLCFSRPGYETTLRRLVLSTCENVRYTTASASGLVPHPYFPNTVGAVRARSQAGETELSASLVIDCTGQGYGGLRWLQDFPFHVGSRTGKNSIPLSKLKITYDSKMAYSTCEFDIPPSAFNKFNALGLPRDFENAGNLYVSFPDAEKDWRVLAILRGEKNILQILCGGWGNEEKMTSISDIESFASKLILDQPLPGWISEMWRVLHEGDFPATYVFGHAPPSVYVRYCRAERIPNNFIAIGDSVLMLNPIRGQGCTKACVEAVTLNAMLSRCVPSSSNKGGRLLPDNFSRLFFSAQAKRTGYLWDSQKIVDFAWKSTIPMSGEDRDSTGAWKRAFGTLVIHLITTDREVATILWHCRTWLTPPTDMFSPIILIKVAWLFLRLHARKLWN